jgi:hypothetical protein
MWFLQRFCGPRRFWLALGLLALAAASLGCPGPKPAGQAGAAGPELPPGPHGEKAFLLALFRQHYLWRDDLPEVDVRNYATSRELVQDLAQRASGGRDRWTCLRQGSGAPRDSLSRFGMDSGFGFNHVYRDGQVQVTEVLPGTSAHQAGVRRGDRLLNHAPALDGLDRVHLDGRDLARSAYAIGGTWPESPVPLGQAWCFRIQRAGTGEIHDHTLRKHAVHADPVPRAADPRVLPAGPCRVGYLPLREFSPAADAGLRQAMAQFRERGVTDLIVDLRYNPGGNEETLVLLANLLCPPEADHALMFRLNGNGRRVSQPTWFRMRPESVRPGKLAFIVTRDSGSASEAVIHVLAPYYRRNLALVGQRTHGKPVSCGVFPVPGCGLELNLVVQQMENADGGGGYFDGLPDARFPGDTCAAEDDLGHAPGDPAEASTAAALRWIVEGSSERGPIP